MTTSWVARGFTDDVTECDHCGRQELKGTVRLEAMTRDGGSEGEIYAGVICAARLSGRKAADIRREARSADLERAAAIREAWDAWSDARTHFICTTRDRHFDGVPRVPEICAYRSSVEFKEIEISWIRANPCPTPPPGYEHVAARYAAGVLGTTSEG